MQHADALAAILMGLFAAAVGVWLWRARRGHVPYVRRLAGIAALEEAVGRATEMGRPIIFAMGCTDVQRIETHASLAVLGHVARLAARMRTPLLALVRVANTYPITEEVMREAYTTEGVPDQFRAEEQVRYLSEESVVYAMGVARLIEETGAGCAIFFGAFDFTSLLMAEPGARMGVLQIAGDPSLYQIPFFVCTCSHTVVGEEYFAAGAYVSSDPTMRGTLVSQDAIKAILAALIVVGTVAAQLAWGPAQWLVDLLSRYQ